ncbi:Crp/Fnr family transcriptional regulator [Oscillatoria amoena NRMC-F 0135]|nr:Crp/Fnr family transcriptional regulator [Oscillatoria amoena NRMC-F 0135]
MTHLNCVNCQSLALSVFCTLTCAELQELNEHKNSKMVKKGYTIFKEGEKAYGLYCVHEGRAKVYRTDIEGNDQIVRLAKEGDILGYRSLLGNEYYQATAKTLQECTICFIPKEHLYRMLEKNLSLSLKIMEKLSLDIGFAEKRGFDFINKTAHERLAEGLIQLIKAFGTTKEGYINIALTREDLGKLLGMATETVIRALKEWEVEGIISLNKKWIKINLHEQLLNIANVEN